jgi:hypothetical protein
MISEVGQETTIANAAYPPFLPKMDSKATWNVPLRSLQLPLPLQCTAQPRPWAAAAARTFMQSVDEDEESLPLWCHQAMVIVLDIAHGYQFDRSGMEMIYMSPSPYHDAFDEVINIRRFDLAKHHTAVLSLLEKNGRLILEHMYPSTPGAKIPRWRTRLHGAWLIKIANHTVTSIEDARKAVALLSTTGTTSAHLLFAHPDIRPDISRRGIPIVSSEPFSLLTHAQLTS